MLYKNIRQMADRKLAQGADLTVIGLPRKKVVQ